MLDFWETMGRMTANENGLWTKLLADQQLKIPNNTIAFAPTPQFAVVEALQIPTDKYAHLRSILDQEIRFRPLSLFGLGEWLRVLPLKDIAGAFAGLATTGLPLSLRSPAFYACLGAMISDDTFAAEFADDPTRFPLLTDRAEIDDLRGIAADVTPRHLMDTAVPFCCR